MNEMAVTYRVGVDIGGTFTDIVLLGSDGTIHTQKVSSNVADYAGFLKFAAADAADNTDGAAADGADNTDGAAADGADNADGADKADAKRGRVTEAIYLKPLKPDDGSRGHEEHEAIKTLAAVSFGPSGSVRTQKVVDTDVCSCCSTDIGFTA